MKGVVAQNKETSSESEAYTKFVVQHWFYKSNSWPLVRPHKRSNGKFDHSKTSQDLGFKVVATRTCLAVTGDKSRIVSVFFKRRVTNSGSTMPFR